MRLPGRNQKCGTEAVAPFLSAVIVNYNTSDLLRRCLEALGRELSPFPGAETILVNNAPPDALIDELRGRFPALRLIQNERNMGYSYAVNQGLNAASGVYLLVLNPDVILAEGAVAALVEAMERNPRLGLAGPKLLNVDGSLQYSCRRFYTVAAMLQRRAPLGRLSPRRRAERRHLMLDEGHDQAMRVDWLLGSCMLVRRSALEKVGPMDTRFFLYFEDVDWCLRMWRGGWPVFYCPEARARHLHVRSSAGGAFSQAWRWHLQSCLKFFWKYKSIPRRPEDRDEA